MLDALREWQAELVADVAAGRPPPEEPEPRPLWTDGRLDVPDTYHEVGVGTADGEPAASTSEPAAKAARIGAFVPIPAHLQKIPISVFASEDEHGTHLTACAIPCMCYSLLTLCC